MQNDFKPENYVVELKGLDVYNVEDMDEDEIDAILAAQEEITDEEINKEWLELMKEFEGK